MGREQYGIIYSTNSIKKTQFDIDEALTFRRTAHAVDFYENVVPFEVYSS